MGYTHYWNFKKNPNDIKDGEMKFKKAVTLLKKGLKKIPRNMVVEDYVYDWASKKVNAITLNLPFKLAGGIGVGKPVITDTIVWFNGDAKEGNNHETFYIRLDGKNDMKFCKTEHKPYDVAVCLALICFKEAFGKNFSYSSDGNNDDWGWKLAHEIFDSI